MSEDDVPRNPRRSTMTDVAAAAGVSLKTVSRVVNNEPTVNPRLAERVLAAIHDLGFRRNNVAASLRSGRTMSTVGLVIEDLANAFYSAIASAVAEVARQHGCQLITESSEENADLERAVTLNLCQRRVDGLLIVPAGSDQSYLRTEIELGTPAVFLDRPPNGVTADAVLMDNRGGARAAVEHLIAAGHERIGVIIDALSIYTMQERLAGVRDALTAAGLPLDDNLLSVEAHSPEAAAKAMAAMLELATPPTAVFCGNNRSTIGVVEQLWRQNTTLDVVGFDDFELSRFLPRRVSIIDYDVRALGRLGAQMLFDRIAGDRSKPRTVQLSTRIVERGIDPNSKPTAQR